MRNCAIYTSKDEIIEELREIKYKIAASHNFSVSELVTYLKKKEKAHKMIISSPLKRRYYSDIIKKIS